VELYLHSLRCRPGIHKQPVCRSVCLSVCLARLFQPRVVQYHVSSCSCCGTLTYHARRRYVKSRYLSEHITNDSGKMGTDSPRSNTKRHKKLKECVASDSVWQCTGIGSQLQYRSLISLTANTAQNKFTAHSASLHSQHISTSLPTQQHHPHCTSLL